MIPGMTATRTHFRTCNLCEAMCGLELEVQGDVVTAIKGDSQDAFSRGYHCIKGEALADLHAGKERLKRPLKRTGSTWTEIGWDEALDEVATKLHALQQEHGPDSVASYIGNPNVHNYGSLLYLQGLLRQLRSKNRYAATSVDQLPHHMVGYFLFGHQLLLPIPDIDHTDFMIIMGGNPLVSRGSMMSAPDVTTRLKAIRERGGTVVLIDPRKTETAAVADEHLFIRPGTDAALLLAMLHVVFADNLVKLRHLENLVDGLDEIRRVVKEYTPERVAAFTGIEATAVRSLATRFANAKSAVCYGRVGVSTQEFGTLAQWLLTVLNVVTGNLDHPGGAMFTLPALDPLPHVSRGHHDKWRSRVRQIPEFAGELPVSVLAEEMLTPGKGQIKGLLTSAGNPALSTPNGLQLEKALAGLEFFVAIDLYLNETTRFAHIILPPTGNLEHEHYDAGFHMLAVRNTAKFSPPCFAPEAGTRHDWQIMAGLERRLVAKARGFGQRLQAQASRLASPERILALGLRFGPYGAGLNPLRAGLTLGKLKKHPHGIDLGPLKTQFPQRLFTKNKRINLAPDLFVKDLDRLRPRVFTPAAPPAGFDLVLIGRRQVRVNNSWMGHIERLTKGRPTCTLLMHSQDAAKRGIVTGNVVRVTTRVGSIEIPATIVDGIMPGVISIPHGFGHTRSDVRLPIPEHARGVSVNEITDETVLDALSGNAVFNGVPVRVERA